MGPAYKHRSTTSVCMPARCHGSCTLMKAYENVPTLPMLLGFVSTAVLNSYAFVLIPAGDA